MIDLERECVDDFALLSHARGNISSADTLTSRAADIEEIKSLVFEHDVWEVLSPKVGQKSQVKWQAQVSFVWSWLQYGEGY